jgi:hypothetical protein
MFSAQQPLTAALNHGEFFLLTLDSQACMYGIWGGEFFSLYGSALSALRGEKAQAPVVAQRRRRSQRLRNGRHGPFFNGELDLCDISITRFRDSGLCDASLSLLHAKLHVAIPLHSGRMHPTSFPPSLQVPSQVNMLVVNQKRIQLLAHRADLRTYEITNAME